MSRYRYDRDSLVHLLISCTEERVDKMPQRWPMSSIVRSAWAVIEPILRSEGDRLLVETVEDDDRDEIEF